MRHSPQQTAAATYGRDTLGLLPHGGAAGLAGTGGRPQLDYYRVFRSPDFPDLLFLEAVRVQLSGLPLDAALDDTWYTVDAAGTVRPFDRFTELSPLARATWSQGLVEITDLP